MQRIRFFEVVGAAVILSLTALAGISCVKADSADQIEGVTWVLKSYGEQGFLETAIAEHEPTLTFDKEKGEIGGSGGVNLYGGKYEIDGNNLEIKELYQTLIASTDAALNNQEAAYMKILNSAERYKIEGEELTITGTEGVLVFMQE
jgi:heat shock protein HslJ